MTSLFFVGGIVGILLGAFSGLMVIQGRNKFGIVVAIIGGLQIAYFLSTAIYFLWRFTR